LSKLTSVSEGDVVALENGQLEDISHHTLCRILAVLGLAFDLPTLQARSVKNGLKMAALNTSISYKNEMGEEDLREILKSGVVPDYFASNIIHFLDETPLPMVVMAAEEAAADMTRPEIIWENLQRLAVLFDSHRKEIWT